MTTETFTARPTLTTWRTATPFLSAGRKRQSGTLASTAWANSGALVRAMRAVAASGVPAVSTTTLISAAKQDCTTGGSGGWKSILTAGFRSRAGRSTSHARNTAPPASQAWSNSLGTQRTGDWLRPVLAHATAETTQAMRSVTTWTGLMVTPLDPRIRDLNPPATDDAPMQYGA